MQQQLICLNNSVFYVHWYQMATFLSMDTRWWVLILICKCKFKLIVCKLNYITNWTYCILIDWHYGNESDETLSNLSINERTSSFSDQREAWLQGQSGGKGERSYFVYSLSYFANLQTISSDFLHCFVQKQTYNRRVLRVKRDSSCKCVMLIL